MKERPILFSAPMVRAILDGSKTQTRRVVKPQPNTEHDSQPYWNIGGYRAWQFRGAKDPLRMGTHNPIACPYGQPGDRLWVRESHYLHGIWSVRKDDDGKRRWTFHPNPDMGAQFTEPNGLINGRSTTVAGWYRRPSIHMPRWASRITLEVTGVRVERLQDISDEDCLAEGIYPTGTGLYPGAPKAAYQKLWVEINGPGSWDANPWVWVVEFKRVDGGAK